MKKFIKIVSLSLVLVLLSTQFVLGDTTEKTAENIKFSDLNETHPAYEGIQKLVEAGIVSGYPDGTFKPDGDITRAELVKIANMVFEYTEKQETTTFKDVKAEDWFCDNVLIAQKAGYILGYEDKTFRPGGLITRQELCKILVEINNFVLLPYDKSVADEVSPWAVDYVNIVLSNRIMTLDANNNFRATDKATRAEVCEALSGFVLPQELEEEKSGGGTGGGTGGDSSAGEVSEAMSNVTRRLEKGTLPNLTTDAQKEIVNDIITNMKAYQSDNSHDYESAAKDTYEKYKKLSDSERDELKYQISKNNVTSDLLELKDFFFPED